MKEQEKHSWRVRQSDDCFHCFYITPSNIEEPDYSVGCDKLDDNKIEKILIEKLNDKVNNNHELLELTESLVDYIELSLESDRKCIQDDDSEQAYNTNNDNFVKLISLIKELKKKTAIAKAESEK